MAETLEVSLGLGASRRTFVEAGSSSVHCLSLIAEDVVQDPELAPAKEFILLMGEKLTALQVRAHEHITIHQLSYDLRFY